MDYPYMTSNNKISQIFDKIVTAAKPAKFTVSFLKQLGFTSSNDFAFIPLLKKMGFLTGDGTPLQSYDSLRDTTVSKKVIANQIKELYSQLFTINLDIHKAPEEEIKGAISRVTGKEEKDVQRIFLTFKALCSYADFKADIIKIKVKQTEEETKPVEVFPIREFKNNEFHYNIQIHLPATTDISVYNAIFKSLKENLLVN
jgi:hypothetical protein